MSTITLLVGPNGVGKTWSAMQLGALPCFERGRIVASSVTLYPEELGFSRDLFFDLDEPIAQLPRLGRYVWRICPACKVRCRFDVCAVCQGATIEFAQRHPDGGLWSLTRNEGCGLILDEITALFPSRESGSVPPELQVRLNQLRKPDIGPVVISAPAYGRCDVMLREVLHTVVVCAPWFPRVQRSRIGTQLLKVATAPSTPWGWWSYGWYDRYFFDAESYEAARSNPMMAGELRPYRRSRVASRKVREAVYAIYDTNEDVRIADHLYCTQCGGRHPKLSCRYPDEHRALARAARSDAIERYYLTPDVLAELGLHVEAEQIEDVRAELERSIA